MGPDNWSAVSPMARHFNGLLEENSTGPGLLEEASWL